MTLSLVEDFRVRELLPIKVLLFLQSAGDMALYPFFTLHMKSLGISLTDIGIQFAVTPMATLIATPLVGLLADKMGNFRHILSFSLLLTALLASLFIFIPKIEQIPECIRNNQPITMQCPTTGSTGNRSLLLSFPNCLKSNPIKSSKRTASPLVLLTLNDCHINCENGLNGQLCLYAEADGNYCFNLSQTLSSSSSSSPSSFLGKLPLTIQLSPDSDKLHNLGGSTLDAALHTITFNSATYLDLICRSNSICTVKCPLKAKSIPNHYQAIVDEPTSKRITFWSYLIVRVLIIVVIATEMSLLKSAILTIVDKNNSEYGYQRLWASIANIFIPPLTGIAMDQIRRAGHSDAFAPCFIIYCSFKVIMAVVTLFIQLDIKPPSVNILSKVYKLLRNKEAAIFLFFVTFIGSTWGFIETFITLFLEELNSSRFVMGVSLSVGAISGIPFTIFAGSIERKIGHVNILIIGILVYGLRLVGYSFAPNAYIVLIFESLEGVTSTLLLITITTYASTLSSTELLATMQSTWAALHFSVGRALGSVIGGYLFSGFGSRRAYQIWAITCLIAGTIYTVIHMVYVKSKEQKRRDAMKLSRSAKNITNGTTFKKIDGGQLNPNFTKE